MFNGKARREAVEKLQDAINRHESIRKDVEERSVELFEVRQWTATEVIQEVERYVNRLANSPKEFKKSVADFRIEANRFDHTVQKIEAEAIRANKIGSGTGGAGVLAGAGVAMYGPTAAMAIATTFGTASTGTAISALSGAAATNAALAWLGGGALAAGGGGMAAGNALLMLAGPVGWTIGGAAIVGSGIYLHQRNAKFAKEAATERINVEAELRSLQSVDREIEGLKSQTKRHSEGILEDLLWMKTNAPSNYRRFTADQKKRMAALINHVKAAGELLGKEVVFEA